MAELDFAALDGTRCAFGESPVYDARRDTLWFADIAGRTLHRVGLATLAHRTYSFESEVCSLGVAISGRLVVALRKHVGLFDPEAEAFERLAEIEPERPETRLNDGKVGPDGAFYVGSMDDRPERSPIGTLYRVDGAGQVETRVTGLRTSNGLAFTSNGRFMFHSDTRAGWIDRWRFDPLTGAMADRTRFAQLEDADGRPDGGATDVEDGYWSAGPSAGRLNRFAADGRRVASYAVPAAAPTMPCFGGSGLSRLFVTSLTSGLSQQRRGGYPLNGATLVADSPVAGTPVGLFRDVD